MNWKKREIETDRKNKKQYKEEIWRMENQSESIQE